MISSGFLLVQKPDASDVTMADLQDHRMATLIAINSKILDDGQRTWSTYETELLGAVRMVQKHGSYITTLFGLGTATTASSSASSCESGSETHTSSSSSCPPNSRSCSANIAATTLPLVASEYLILYLLQAFFRA